MPITYPISLPAEPVPERLVLRRRDIVGASESIYTGQMQVHKHQGEWWEAEVILPPLTRAEAAQWDAALESLRGQYGTFLLGDASRTSPLGTPVGSPAVDGAGQAGTQLATKNWNGVAKGGNLGGEDGDTLAASPHWLVGGPPDLFEIVNDAANARSGSWVFRRVGDGATTAPESLQGAGDNEFSVAPGDRVDAQVWVKTEGGANGGALLRISFLGTATGAESASALPATEGVYEQRTASGVAPAGTTSARISLISVNSHTAGTWYADDFTVTHYSAATGLLLPGDYIQLGSGTTQRLHRVLTQVDCDQTGDATLDLWPRLRESPADGALLVLTNAQGVFRLAGPTEVERLPGGFSRLSFLCREAI